MATWIEQRAIGFGIGAVLGQSGHNQALQHCAHQLTIAIEPTHTVQVLSKNKT